VLILVSHKVNAVLSTLI